MSLGDLLRKSPRNLSSEKVPLKKRYFVTLLTFHHSRTIVAVFDAVAGAVETVDVGEVFVFGSEGGLEFGEDFTGAGAVVFENVLHDFSSFLLFAVCL